MKKSNRTGLKTILVLVLILALVIIGGKTLFDVGEFDTIWDHPLDDCHELALTGAEDMTLVDNGSRVLISAADRQGLDKGQQSGIYLYDGSYSPKLIYPTEGEPQGISSVATETGTRVFVIVHKAAQDVVQILDWASDSLTLVKELPFDKVTTLNGIVAIDGERFFASQELASSFKPFQEIEKLLRLSMGKLWLYDGRALRIARDKIIYPNGLALSPDKKILYVASMLNRSLIVFDYDPTTYSVQWRNQFPLQTAPDNLHWAGDRLLIGSHPKLLRLMAHSHDALRFPAPSQVIVLDGLPDKPSISEAHSSKGGLISAISSAVVLKDRVLLGSIYTKGMLTCAALAEKEKASIQSTLPN